MSHIVPDDELRSRLLSGLLRDPETGCWNWQRSRTKGGYGTVNVDGRTTTVPRAMYLEFIGEIPDDWEVRHVVCRNPRCANPRHIAIGTRQDQFEDKKKDGTNLFGEAVGTSSLTDEKVRRIRELAGTKPYSEIAEEVGTSEGNVGNVILGKTWTHLPISRDVPFRNNTFRRRGTSHSKAKFTENDIRFIRNSRGALTTIALAKKFNTTSATVSKIQLKHTWSHVKDSVND